MPIQYFAVPEPDFPHRWTGDSFPELGQPGRRHPSLKDRAERHIRMAIVSGALTAGQKIDQDAIAEELGISRLPVREAMIELTARGYVRSVPRRGVFVAELAEEDIIDHFDALGRIFGLAARRAAAQITEAQVEDLRRVHDQILSTADPQRDRVLNVEFYQFINRLGSSESLQLILQSLSLALPNDLYMTASSWSVTEAVYRERMIVALANHDGDGATQVAEEHLRTCGQVTVRELEAAGYWAEADAAS